MDQLIEQRPIVLQPAITKCCTVQALDGRWLFGHESIAARLAMEPFGKFATPKDATAALGAALAGVLGLETE